MISTAEGETSSAPGSIRRNGLWWVDAVVAAGGDPAATVKAPTDDRDRGIDRTCTVVRWCWCLVYKAYNPRLQPVYLILPV